MGISTLKGLFISISSFLSLYSDECVDSEPVMEYYQKVEEMLKLLNPILECVVDLDVISDELLNRESRKLCQLVDDSRDLFETWHPLMSILCFVLQIESLISRSRATSLEFLILLKSYHESLPANFSLRYLESCIEKIKLMVYEETSNVVKEVLKEEADGAEPIPNKLLKIAESLNLRSNQELLIEAVALEKLKESAEQGENNEEAEYIDKLISLVTHVHEHLLLLKQSQICSPIPIPPDFCCPLSLNLMTDPVIVESGQTYERTYINDWINLGLIVCPKTRKTLANTTLIPNYTVKALIAGWCESNNVRLPDPVRPSDLILYHRTTPPVSPKSTGSLARSGGIQRDEMVPLHPRSSSEGCLPLVGENGHALGRKSLSLSSPRGSREGGVGNGSIERILSPSSRLSNVHETRVLYPESKDASDAPGDAASSEPTVRDSEPKFRSHAMWSRGDRFVATELRESRSDCSSIEPEVRRLAEDLKSGSANTQREASAEIRLLAKHNMDNRIVIANSGAIPTLVALLRSPDLPTQENAVTALLNLSINDNNKTLIANGDAIEPLIHVLRTGSAVARENSAATLFSLSVMEENKAVIGRSGAIGPLVELLGSGTPRGKKDAATALYNLSIFAENKGRILEAGAVRHLVELMEPGAGMVDKAVAVLANLATVAEGRVKIGQERGIPLLVEVVELGSARGKENAAAALLHLCTHSPRFCNMVLQEGAVPPLVALSQSGTPRAKEKAQSLLTLFRNQRHSNGGRS